MTEAQDDSFSADPWPLARVLILVLAGAFGGLMADIRVEHVDVVRERAVAWLPIIYCGVMTIACCGAFLFWNKTARLVMTGLFSLAFVLGGAGFYLHNHGDLTQVVRSSVGAWTDSKMSHSEGPPQTAPLAFAGLGVLGILASSKRFNGN